MTAKYTKSLEHIARVRGHMDDVQINLIRRARRHDRSKLEEPERGAYEGLDEKLVGVEFGSPAYRLIVKEHLGPALVHHYAHNSHHPEYFSDGFRGMSLLDLLEMLCDLRAVCDEKGKDEIDLEINQRTYGWGDELMTILQNTIHEMGWFTRIR